LLVPHDERLLAALRSRAPANHESRLPETAGLIAMKLPKRTSKEARLAVKLLSLAAGAFLMISGGFGTTAIVLGGGTVYVVGSLYAVAFGALVLCVEIKDKVRFVSAIYALIDKEMKFLTFQTGKGIFYFGVGLLLFFIEPQESRICRTVGATNTSHGHTECRTPHYSVHWGVINVAALLIAIVGFLHAFHIVLEPSDSLKESMLPATQIDGESITTLQPIAIGPPGTEPSAGSTVWPVPRPATDNPFFFEPGQGRARVDPR